jgi:hypothetical protein
MTSTTGKPVVDGGHAGRQTPMSAALERRTESCVAR